MDHFETPNVTFQEPVQHRPVGSRFRDLSDRFSRAFSPVMRTAPARELEAGRPYADGEDDLYDELLPRFPITRSGYDRDAVDGHVADLERELFDLEQQLGDLRASATTKNEVAEEIDRIGAQTSSVLLAAHETAQETIQLAHAQADRCVAEATIKAEAITAQANERLADLQADLTSLGRERERLLDEIRSTSTALLSLVGDPS